MRTLLAILISTVFAATALAAEDGVTAEDGILCLAPSSLHQANQPEVAKSQQRLRALGCLRAEPGIRLTVLDGPKIGGPLRIRFYPQGISTGVTLWGLPSSFKLPDGSAFLRQSIGG
jgi:hypothetical protein